MLLETAGVSSEPLDDNELEDEPERGRELADCESIVEDVDLYVGEEVEVLTELELLLEVIHNRFCMTQEEEDEVQTVLEEEVGLVVVELDVVVVDGSGWR